MAEVIDLVPKGAIERLSRKKKAGRFRLVALAKTQRSAAVQEEAREASEEVPDEAETAANAVDPADCSSGQDGRAPSAGETPALPAEDCFELFEVREGCLAVVWKLGKVDDWGAPVLGAACKEILEKSGSGRSCLTSRGSVRCRPPRFRH
jgi:hypothetical protein